LCVDIFIPNDIYLEGGKGFGSNNKNQQDQLSSLHQSSGDIQKAPIVIENTINNTNIYKTDSVIEIDSSTKPTTTTAGQQAETFTITDNQQQESFNSVQVVTGANFSGKSVYLKQIALIVYMAHVGR
jgi:hypothetical protein